MRAVSLNYRDLLMIRGTYDPRVPRPLIPCSDGVGVVEAVGEGVNLDLGSRQMPIFSSTWLDGPPLASHLKTTRGGPLPGTLSDTLVLPASAMVAAPKTLTDVEAATLPCAGVTAWHALETAGVGAGSTVLTLGTGGVSMFALQLAKLRGARVAITSSSDERLAVARSHGADLTLNYTSTPRWGREVAAWAGEGVDAVVEVGGAGTLDQSMRATRVGGTLVLIGVLDGGVGEVSLVTALMRSLRLQGLFVGSRAHAADLVADVDARGLRPIVSQVFERNRVAHAFEALSGGGQLGKVVIDLTAGVHSSMTGC